MLGFRSKTPWKSMIAVLYYALSFSGFVGGAWVGVAVLVIAWSLPAFCLALYEAHFKSRKEQYYAIPVFIAVLGISAVLFAVDLEVKTKSATAVNAVAEINTISRASLKPETTDVPSENKVYITSSGSKYHSDGCRFIKDRQVISVTVDEATSRGLYPCSVCSE